VWRKAEAMCKDRGGLIAADHSRAWSVVAVRCGDGQELFGKLY
jgi:hypothetical protein